MSKHVWLSVLIPVYNTEAYLAECIESVLSQAMEGVELILYDDGSSDGSKAICRSFQTQHPNVVTFVEAKQNGGIAAARNTLLQRASGEYIWFIDSDDSALPGSLEKIKVAIDAHAPELIILDYLKNTSTYRKSFQGEGGRVSFDKNALICGAFKYRKMYCWQKVIQKDVFTRNPAFPHGQLFEDLFVMPQLLFSVQSHYYISEPCLSYRIRQGSIMAAVTRSKGAFSVKKHDDLCDALGQLSMVRDLQTPLSLDAQYYVSNYIAREYIKLAKRYKSSDTDVSKPLAHYRVALEAASPISFQKLTINHLKRGNFILFFKLSKALRG